MRILDNYRHDRQDARDAESPEALAIEQVAAEGLLRGAQPAAGVENVARQLLESLPGLVELKGRRYRLLRPWP